MCVGHMQTSFIILCKGLERPWILVSLGGPRTNPYGYRGTAVAVSCLRACKRRKWNLNSSLTAVNSSFFYNSLEMNCAESGCSLCNSNRFLPDFNLGGCIFLMCLSERLQQKHHDQLENTMLFFFF